MCIRDRYINKGKNAVPTNRGWENSVTGEVYISHRGLKDKMIAAGHLVEKAAPVKKEVKKVEESSLSSMTKDQLEAYAQEKFDVDLDKRKTKAALIEEIEEMELAVSTN